MLAWNNTSRSAGTATYWNFSVRVHFRFLRSKAWNGNDGLVCLLHVLAWYWIVQSYFSTHTIQLLNCSETVKSVTQIRNGDTCLQNKTQADKNVSKCITFTLKDRLETFFYFTLFQVLLPLVSEYSQTNMKNYRKRKQSQGGFWSSTVFATSFIQQ